MAAFSGERAIQRGTRQARCKARMRLSDCFSCSVVAGSAMRERRFSSSSQTTTDSGQIRTSKLSRHSPSSQYGSARPETICTSASISSSEGGDAISAVANAREQKRKNIDFIIGGLWEEKRVTYLDDMDQASPSLVQFLIYEILDRARSPDISCLPALDIGNKPHRFPSLPPQELILKRE